MSPSRSLTGWAAPAIVSGWVLLTGMNQHPNRAFDFARTWDSSGMLLPNWRFFAPNPAVHDFRVAHRVMFEDESVSAWIDTRVIPERRWYNAFYFPTRRRDKGITDIAGTMTEALSKGHEAVEKMTGYAVLTELVRAEIQHDPTMAGRRILGFQWVLGRDTGFETDEDAQVFLASRLHRWSEAR